MNRRMMVVCILAVSLLGFTLQGCGGATDDTIKVVTVGPMTGGSAEWGQSMQEGVEMAVEEINEAGGVLGKQLEASFEDDQGDPGEAATVAQRISSDEDVTAVIGHFFTSCTLAAAPIYQRAGIPEIAIASTHPDATAAGDYIFRINVTNTHQGAGIVRWLVEDQGKNDLAFIYVNDDYGNGIVTIAEEMADELGANVVFKDSVEPEGEQDFMVLLTNAKEADPDALVLLTFYSAGAQLVRQADRVGMDALIVGSDGLYSQEFIEIAGESAEDVYIATWFHPETDATETRTFTEAYQERYGRTTDSWAPYAYDALYLLVDAIERAGEVDRQAIRDSLAVTEGFVGATGITTFTEERVPDALEKELLFIMVEDGEFKLVQ